MGENRENLRRCDAIGGADIYAGEDIAGMLPAAVGQKVESCRILLIADKAATAVAAFVAESFAASGYRVSVRGADEEFEPEEQCRFVLAAGAGKAAEKAKAAARTLGAECGVLLTAPTTERILAGGGVSQVYLDGRLLDSCPRRCYAAGLGILLSRPVTAFDDFFDRKLSGGAPPAVTAVELPRELGGTELALGLLRAGAETEDRARPTPVEAVAGVLPYLAKRRGRQPRMRGEYMFVAACALRRLYSLYLSSPAIDALPPADSERALTELAALTGRSRASLAEMFDFLGVSGYFRINYIVGEYRLDLIEKLSAIDLVSAERRWRRTYEDAGWFLRGALTARDMTDAMVLAGGVSGGLLHHMFSTGFLDAMTALPRQAAGT